MKNYIFYLLICFFLISCGKEDVLTPKIDYFNLYEITDDPNDPIQHLRYQIYKDYNVSVFFTDTVGKYPLSTDINGNIIYEYELFDLNWEFTSYVEDTDISFCYITDEDQKLRALEFAKNFLASISAPLRPLSIFLADTLFVDAGLGNINTTEYHNFRSMVWAKVSDLDEEEQASLIGEVKKKLVKEKIKNNTNLIANFNIISNNYYNKYFPTPLPAYDNCITEIVNDENPMANPSQTWIWQTYVNLVYGQRKTHEQAMAEINRIRGEYCSIVGAWGFIYGYGTFGNTQAPSSDDDFTCYVEQILLDGSAAWFEKYYATYPLVMKKYEMLRDYIENDLEVELK